MALRIQASPGNPFENQVGRSTLAVTVDSVRLPDLPVEVVSAKPLPRGVDESLLKDHPLYYPNFLHALWQEKETPAITYHGSGVVSELPERESPRKE